MKIVICDDDKHELAKMNDYIKKYSDNRPELQIEIKLFSSSNKLMDDLELYADYDIALLDICMPGILGIKLAQFIKNNNKRTSIIFVTTSKEYAIDAFSIGASHYILKPFVDRDIEVALDRAVSEVNKYNSNNISLNTTDGIWRSPIKNIIYIESIKNYQYIHDSNKKVYRVRMTSQNLYEKVKEHKEMMKLGASFIINLLHVHVINKTFIELDDNTIIGIPRGLYEKVKAKYFEYYCGGEN